MRYLTIALPKGRLLGPLVEIFNESGVFDGDIDEDSRRLIFTDDERRTRIILVKPTDVPTYVEYGAADIGVAGKDVLLEADKNLCELLDLGTGYCRLVVAVPTASGITNLNELGFNSRVATKFPGITAKFFAENGIQAEIVKLHGSIELGPLIGLSDAIVDITSSGQTLKENGLRIIAEIEDSTARLVANRISYKTEHKRIREIVDILKERVDSLKDGGF